MLGQIEFFDRFTVTMNRQSQALAISAVEDFDDRYPQPLAPLIYLLLRRDGRDCCHRDRVGEQSPTPSSRRRNIPTPPG